MKVQRKKSMSPRPVGPARSAAAGQPPAAKGWTPGRPTANASVPLLPRAAPAPLTLEALPGSSAWAALPALSQRQVETVLGADGHRGMVARAEVKALLAGPGFEALPPAEQAAAIRGVLARPPVLPGLAIGELGPSGPRPHTVGAPEAAGRVDFPGQAAAATRVEVTIGGKTVSIVAPADGHFTPDTQLSVEEVASALSAMPPEALARVAEVRLAPTKNPEDAFWAQQYGRAEFSTFMNCGSDGVVTIFPQTTKVGASGVASTLVHETGHAWSMKDWGGKDSAPWQAWKSAGARDGLPPSQYGAHNLDEDLAETQTLFLESRGRPEYATYRALYPHRFAILEQRFGGSP
ncbi:MAG: hypothetical protein Q8L48_29790 [Archangium sp.]|nr:hypothetical protein [Archangium sp.]